MLGLLRLRQQKASKGSIPVIVTEYDASNSNMAEGEVGQHFSFLDKLADCVNSVDEETKPCSPEEKDTVSRKKMRLSVNGCRSDETAANGAKSWYQEQTEGEFTSDPETPKCFDGNHTLSLQSQRTTDKYETSISDDETASVCSCPDETQSCKDGEDYSCSDQRVPKLPNYNSNGYSVESDDESIHDDNIEEERQSSDEESTEDDDDDDEDDDSEDNDGDDESADDSDVDEVEESKKDTKNGKQTTIDSDSEGCWVTEGSDEEYLPRKVQQSDSSSDSEVEMPTEITLPPVSKESQAKEKQVQIAKQKKFQRQGGRLVETVCEEDKWDNLDTFISGLSNGQVPSVKKKKSRRVTCTEEYHTSYYIDSDEEFMCYSGRPTGSTLGYAFPKVKPSDIEDVVNVWETDYQVDDKIAPRMGSWENLGNVPCKEGDPASWKKYVAYKNLYTKWVQCNSSKQRWFDKYWCKSLKQILLMKNFENNPPKTKAVSNRSQTFSTADANSRMIYKRNMQSPCKRSFNYSCSIESDPDINKDIGLLSVC